MAREIRLLHAFVRTSMNLSFEGLGGDGITPCREANMPISLKLTKLGDPFVDNILISEAPMMSSGSNSEAIPKLSNLDSEDHPSPSSFPVSVF